MSKHRRDASVARRTWKPGDKADGRELQALTQHARLPYVSSSHALTVGVPPRIVRQGPVKARMKPPPSWVETFIQPPEVIDREAAIERKMARKRIESRSMRNMKSNQKRRKKAGF